jgi:uncharacterized protein (TIGR02246 family)
MGHGLVQRYADAMRRGDVDAILTMFADDAVYYTPRSVARGSDEIRSHYASALADGGVALELVSVVEHDDVVVFELAPAGTADDDGPRAIDRATLDASGRITRLAVYSRLGGLRATARG